MPASESSGHVIYNPAASSTSQLAAGQNFSLDYGSGSASGDVYTDFLGVGPISISGYPMETALQVSSDFFLDAYNISGIWGTDMSYYQSQTPLAQPTWLTFAEYEIGSELYLILILLPQTSLPLIHVQIQDVCPKCHVTIIRCRF